MEEDFDFTPKKRNWFSKKFIHSCRKSCKYYEEYGGTEWQGQWQYYDMCYRYYKSCPDCFCLYKLFHWKED